MLLLFETPAGFALFKVLDEGKLSKVEDLWKEFSTPDAAKKVIKLKAFDKFENVPDALSSTTLLIDSKPSKGLRKFLRAHCEGETLAVADSKLGNAIKDKLQINCIHNNAVMELMRCIRSQLTELIAGLAVEELGPMSIGLAHSLSRYKLKFSPDKVDTMIVQAIGLLDDLDKELNIYAMRVKEWYGWHFPEMAKIVQDNILYAKAVKYMGSRSNATSLDFSEMLPEEIEAELKEASKISMGTEVSEMDLINIKSLCEQVISLSEYRVTLFDYLKNRMNTIAPNLAALVGELVGARLISSGGSLLNLAKQPGSTVQILGAEKALFRALKTKHATPKYGLLFHASLVGQAAPKFKGKIARTLAAKSALAVRYDALGDDQDSSMGLENRGKVEARLRALEGRELGRSAGSAKGKPKIEVYSHDRKKGSGTLLTPAKTYNPASDAIISSLNAALNKAADEQTEGRQKKRKHDDIEVPANDNNVGEDDKSEKKKKKKKKQENDNKQEQHVEEPVPDNNGSEVEKSEKKKKSANNEEDEKPEKEKKKKKHVEESVEDDEEEQKKKSKKKKDASLPEEDSGVEKKQKDNQDEDNHEQVEKKKKKKDKKK